MQTTLTSRPRPTIHIHSDVGPSQFLGSRKRKRSSNYSSEDDDVGASYIYPIPTSPVKSTSPGAEDDSETDHKAKRARRALNIEHGMGGMSLSGHMQPSIVDASGDQQPPRRSYDYLHAHNVSEPEHLEIDDDYRIRDDHLDDDLEIVTPNVEEAVSPIVRISGGLNPHLNPRQLDDDDTNMRTSSWYEPEKDRESHSANLVGQHIDQASIRPRGTGIIVTDLSDSETEQDDKDQASTGYSYWDSGDSEQEFIVSPAYLQKFGGPPKSPLPPVGPENSMALVAYRPVPYLPIHMERPLSSGESDPPSANDAMDIDD